MKLSSVDNIYIKGGRAHFNGVSIQSNIGFSRVSFDKKNEQFIIKSGRYIKSDTKISKIINFISKIPFLRSFVLFYNLIKNNKKMVLKIVAIYIVLLFLLFSFDNETLNSVDNFLENGNLSYFVIMLVLSVVIKITSISNYHGAEHMVINYYNKNKNLEFNNLESVTRVSNSCGSVLILITFFFFYAFNLFSSYVDLNFLISYMIAYEVFISKNKLFKPIFYMSGVIQKYILTSKPSEIQLRLAKVALKNAVNKSN